MSTTLLVSLVSGGSELVSVSASRQVSVRQPPVAGGGGVLVGGRVGTLAGVAGGCGDVSGKRERCCSWTSSIVTRQRGLVGSSAELARAVQTAAATAPMRAMMGLRDGWGVDLSGAGCAAIPGSSSGSSSSSSVLGDSGQEVAAMGAVVADGCVAAVLTGAAADSSYEVAHSMVLDITVQLSGAVPRVCGAAMSPDGMLLAVGWTPEVTTTIPLVLRQEKRYGAMRVVGAVTAEETANKAGAGGRDGDAQCPEESELEAIKSAARRGGFAVPSRPLVSVWRVDQKRVVVDLCVDPRGLTTGTATTTTSSGASASCSTGLALCFLPNVATVPTTTRPQPGADMIVQVVEFAASAAGPMRQAESDASSSNSDAAAFAAVCSLRRVTFAG